MLLGAGGQLAADLKALWPFDELSCFSREQLDICQHEKVGALIKEIRPEVLVNTAAYHQVDDCETHMQQAFETNAFAVRNIAQHCNRWQCKMVHFSTDYVFGGAETRPYTEEDLPQPLSVYANSKLAGEHFVQAEAARYILIRTSGLYGPLVSSEKGANFVETMIGLAEEGRSLSVVDDQELSPTLTSDLAEAVIKLIKINAQGIYHVTNADSCSWFKFAQRIFELSGLSPDLKAITSQEFGAPAQRPANSVLNNQRYESEAEHRLRPWDQALKAYIQSRR